MSTFLQPISYTPQELIEELLPQSFIQELREKYADFQPEINGLSQPGNIGIYYQELHRYQAHVIALLTKLAEMEGINEENKKKWRGAYQSTLIYYIQELTHTLQKNLHTFFTMKKENQMPAEAQVGTTLHTSNFESFLQKHHFSLVDFWASWCGPCKALNPILEEVIKKFEGKLTLGKVNVDQERSLVDQYHVQSMPTLILFKNGKEVTRLIGLQTEENIRKSLEQAMSKR